MVWNGLHNGSQIVRQQCGINKVNGNRALQLGINKVNGNRALQLGINKVNGNRALQLGINPQFDL